VQPIILGPSMPDTFYRGAGRPGRLRGEDLSTPPAARKTGSHPRHHGPAAPRAAVA
jgi:hypothetical protein